MTESVTVDSSIPSSSPSEPIAVVGLACRLPGAADPDAYWELLEQGRSAITDVPEGRWDRTLAAQAAVAPDGRSIPARGGFLDAPGAFDAAFFGISPREAAAMDPQQRLVLELGWEALENARIAADGIRGRRAGVFVGATVEDYAALVHQQGQEAVGHHTMPGLNRGLIANRLSYALGLRGPSMTVDSAQSSSLVAVQMACDSLRNGDCDLALAGGVHLNLAPETTIAAARFGALSPDGQCFTFDARANGYVRGEGGGLVVLKPLARALADGDRIRAVIRGGAVNNDGTGESLTTPDPAAQEEVLRLACARAGVDPGHIGYVELHGTGTRVGDPIEAAALGAAFGTAPSRKSPLRVGSAKTNIGHLEGAAGIAGLLKVVLCLEHGRLVPSLNFAAPNPDIALEQLRLRVQQETAEWASGGGRRPLVAGVSSFGMGGTNAHVIVEQAEPVGEPERSGSAGGVVVPWVVSARSGEALRGQVERLGLVAGSPVDVGWSLLRSRSVFEHRAVVVGAGVVAEGSVADVGRGPVFVFPGQGAQWVGMAVGLLDASPVFAARLGECEGALAPFVDWSLADVLRGVEGAPGLDRVDVVQPVLWAVMVSLAELWRSFGVEPAAVVGHSQGEIAAAVVAGGLSLADGARVVALRSRAIVALAGRGGMVSVALPRLDVDELLGGFAGRVSVAAVNGPSSVVVSGDADALDELMAVCEGRGVRVRRIEVDYASHSAHVEAIREELAEVLAPIAPMSGTVPFFSTVTGDWLDTSGLDAEYWYTNLRQTVQLEPSVRALLGEGHGAFVEVSPHPVLTMPIEETVEAVGSEAVVTGTLRRGEGGPERFYASLAELWVRGVAVDWTPAFAGLEPRTVDLPTYAFQREHYWLGTAEEPVRELAVNPADQGRATLDLVREHAAVVLGHRDPDAIDPKRSFKELGFNSVTAVELRNRLNTAVGLKLPTTVLYDHSSPARLAQHIDNERQGTGHPEQSAVPVAAAPGEPIAIVAMSCRYPGGVQSPEDLWRVVRDGLDVVSEFPTDRGWDLDSLYDPDPELSGKTYAREGGFLDAGSFDAAFFGISPREALAMDPQQRLLLETSWEALERAGIEPGSVRGSLTGVFIGAMSQEYGPRLHEAGEGVEGHVLTGTTTSVASGRIAYTLGLEGPAVTVDTACSSSLVAMHLAVQALRSGECSLALAGGATVMSSPGLFVEFSRQRGLAPDGRCKPFAAAADGTGWGEGVGVLVLERLSDARRLGHEVLAVVRGSAINQDGASNGLTAPSGLAQQRVIRAALAGAGLSAADVDVVEAHGTGTTLGDPIEAEALLATYGRGRDAGRPLWLGSVKSNIGHAQAASGVAGVMKMVLAMRHGVLPATLHVDEPSSHVDWSSGAVELLSEARPWEGYGRPRRAGVSSFGVSGTNAHVIIEQAEPVGEPERSDSSDGVVVPWVVSARSREALRAQVERLGSVAGSPVDVGWSLLRSRSVFEHRAVVVGAGVVAEGSAADVGRGPVFVFPGQGAQWVGMAVGLLDASPVFAERVAACEGALAPFVEWSLADVLRGVEGAPGLDRVDVVQPVLWAVMVSLAELWRSFGVEPAAVVGHSQGEIAAAVVAGGLSLADGARVVALRSRAIVALAGRGGMVSVALPRVQVDELLGGFAGRVSVAAVNGPSSVVVSGDADALDELMAVCEGRGVRVRRIEVDYASHSAHVEAIRGELAEVLAPIVPVSGGVPFFSTVTGEWLDTSGLGAEYWYTNLRQTVQLEPSVRALLGEGHRVFVEVSPHPVLTMPVQETAEAVDAEVVVTGTLRRGEGGPERFYASLGELWVHGVSVDWAQAFAGLEPRRVELPTYAFQRQRYWLESGRPAAAADPVDARFWETVEREDLEGLAATLGLADGGSLGEVLPALSSWRKNHKQRSTVDGWRYTIAWRPQPAPPRAELHGPWLLVTSAALQDDQLVQGTLRALEASASQVRTLVVDAQDADRARLAERLGAEAYAGVLSLLALDETPDAVQPAVPAGLAMSLALVQALGDAGVAAPLWCVTRGAVAAAGDVAPANPVQAGVWGLGRVAALEDPTCWGGLVDMPGTADQRAAELLVDVLAAGGAEDQLAIRGSGLFGRRLVRAPLGGKPARRAWHPRGTVLVTGGTGALGARMARWLAANGADHLVLTGRRGAETPGAAELRDELQAHGTRVTLAACDVADREALADLVRRVEQDGGEVIRAVVHAAGVSELGALTEAGTADLAAALAGKVAGAANLDAVLDPAELDAVVYFSSISGTWGVADHGVYAAANAMLDARAEQRRADGLPVLSIAWGPWAGGGMIADSIQDVLRRRGVPVIDPETAVAALQQALDHDETLVAVADVDWQRFGAVFTSVRQSRLLEEIPEAQPAAEEEDAGQPPAAALARQLEGLDSGQRSRMLLDLVREHVALVLGHGSAGAVDAERAFKDLGFDSLTAVELRNRLGRTTGLRLPTTVVFDHPNPAALADYLGAQALGERKPEAAPVAVPTPAADGDDPIAIVAMSCRFPGGVRSPEDLWRVVRDGLDVVSEFPTDRGWDLDALYDPDPDRAGTSYVRESGFLHDAGDFDAAFFGISPREALAMDPQQRLLLETSWEALERAGFDPKSLRGSTTGVYVGLADQEYGSRLRAAAGEAEGYLATGAASSVASGRIAYTLGLEGPAVTVDTACSSSLVAMHLAVQALRSGECSLALAGAVMVMSDPGPFIAFSRQRGLAPDGRCKPFAAAADGFALSEGAGIVVLERLSDARRLGHEVLAVVRGSAINQDGASNGLTAPNGPSQQRVIRAALANAGLSAADVDVVEAHGTGTTLGDPIEAEALLATYGQEREAGRPLWLGSVKSNIGHTQTASGVAGVMKMVLAMRHGVLPATLHVDEPSPHVDWSSGAVELLSEARPWEEYGRPRRAGVSSFGISGTNAHVIVEQGELVPSGSSGAAAAASAAGGVVVPWVVSARSGEALRGQVERLGLVAGSPVDVGWSLLRSRSVFEHRAVVVGAGVVAEGSAADVGRGPVFVFPGQGAQWVGMAVGLLDASPVFAERVAACEAALAPFVDWSLTGVLRGVEGAPGLDRVDVVQPVLWAVMVSLAELWRSFGVVPSAVVGHSQGEIAAAVVAGGLSLADGARVVALRSRAIVALAGRGGMVSVALPRLDVDELLGGFAGRVSVAAVNGPSSVVVSGDADALDELMALCEGRGVRVRRIEVDYASHSAHVEAIRGELAEVLAPIVPVSGGVPFFSTVTGEWLDTSGLGAEYWYTNLRQTVQLEPSVRALLGEGHRVFVEVSPHPVLTMPVQETAEAADAEVVVTGTLRRGEGGPERFYASLGELWVHGVAVDWAPAFAGLEPRRVELPTYAFQRQRYWLEPTRPLTAADPVDARFWETVEREDLEGLAATLGLADGGSLGEVLPALSSWRKNRKQRSTVDGWRYRVVWRPQPEPPRAELHGAWLVAVPEGHQDDDLVQGLLKQLRGTQAQVAEVSVPADADRAGLAKLLAAGVGTAEPPVGVLSLLALDEADSSHGAGVSRGLLGTIALAQALEDADLRARLWCVTRGAVSTGAADGAVSPAQAAVRGLVRVVGLDDPERRGGLVDLPAVPDELSMQRLVGLLSSGGADGGEDEFAVRRSGVQVRRMVRAPFDPARGSGEPWRPHGTVLVTGGTGALGSHVARWLARSGAEHLLLTSRSGLDAPGATELYDELTGAGCRVTVAACDVTDRAAVARLLDTVPDGLPLTAVVHTAGVVGEARPLAETPVDEAVAAVHAKVTGALNLDALLADHPLEAFVLFSSGAGVWGNGGQGPYAAANAHLDALAERRRAQGRPATSVAWGAWAGGGMVDEAVAEQLRRRGVPGMSPESAVQVLHEAVSAEETALVVADIRWERFLPAYSAHGHRPLLDEVPEVRELLAARQTAADTPAPEDDRGSELLRQLTALPEPKRRRRLVELVRTHAGAVLGHSSASAVKPGRAFREMGFDSLTAVELRNRLATASGLKLPATLVFDHPTPNALAEYLHAELPLPLPGSDAVPAELQQVETALRQAADPDTRRAITEGLRALLDAWAGPDGEPAEETAAVDDELVAATDQDMFDLIDRELGIS
ncbi:type I polyketide synthase [Peterkaempfera bronchialis]|uniref:SDR family NAD(P)-dependent oxidoreductase n=1 Tax=Peterkaempfera bronchialis TaxID=2126346 RepID=A0A345T2T1_9ACTN|nr:type I polyketide synthase [Peterkaempfera bronchialis]AXI80286.1 SDR family NAD(P)-dependent oxidoreductase [Peterkaempfera bronchialis]